MSTQTAHTVIKRHRPSEVTEDLTSEEIQQQDLMGKVKLDCLLEVIQAREKGKIGKTNVLKMDRKVNRSIRKILEKDVPFYELTLPEKVKNNKRRLPQPNFEVRLKGPQIKDSVDLTHWKTLPTEVKENEVERMHSFLFNTTKDFES